MESTDKFSFRSYGLGELAMLYNPHLTTPSAVRLFKRWVKYHPDLPLRLHNDGYRPGQRILTPRQVEHIITCLGKP